MDTSPQKKMKGEEEESISVFVRIRPLNAIEKNKNSYSILDAPGTREVIVKERQNTHVTKTFTFDRAFGPNSKQIDVYKAVVSPLLDQVLQGYNCTVFAYGQTGTGKTYTMEGERSQESLNWSEDPKAGIVPRALGQLFDTLREQKAEFTIRVSLLELYNEELYDLLAPIENQKFQNLKMYEDPKNKNILIQGLEEVIVRSKSEVYQIMEKGSERRKTAATWMNAASSRSHTVLTVTVQVKESTMAGDDLIKVGKLHMVDLAGSENIGRSGAVDKRAREAGNINQSLLTLGRVITALVERAPHVPYRESKLTRILKDSLGGNTKTSIIATVSPAYINVEETLSTLEYAHRAKNIFNQPTVNQRLTKHVMLGHYAEEIERLRRDLAATREKNGVFVEKANYDEMQARLIGLEQECTNNATHIRNLNSDVEKLQEDLRYKEEQLEETSKDLTLVRAVLAETTETLNNTRKQLRQTEQEKEVQKHLVEKHVLTEIKINEEATTLMQTADVATTNLERLYSKLERKRALESTNLENGKRMKKEVQEQLHDISESIEKFRTDHAVFCGEQRLRLEEFLSGKDQLRSAWKIDIENLNKTLEAACTESLSLVTAHATAMKSSNSNLDTEVSKRCESMLETVETVISSLNGLRNEVATKLDQIDTEVSVLMDSFKSQLEAQQKQVLSFLAKHMDDMAEQSGSLQCLMDDCEKSAASVTSQLEQRKDATTLQNEEMQKYIAGLFTSLQTMSFSLTESNRNNAEGIDKIVGTLKSNAKDIKGKVEKLQGNSRTQTNTAVHVQQEVIQNYEKNVKAIEEKRPVFANALKEVNTEVSNSTATGEKYGAIQKENIESMQKWHHSTIKGISKGIASFKKIFNSKQEELKTCNSSAIQSNQKYVSKLEEQDTAHVYSYQKSLESHCHEAESWSEDQRAKVQEQAGIVSEFWDTTYLVDNPTGATPRKQNFSYPKTISATSPHDRIISRFRQARRYDDDEDRENF